MTFGKILRRSLLYLGLALASLMVFSLIFILSVRGHISVPFLWIMLAVFTAVLAFTVVQSSREYWSKTSFWITCAVALAVHLAVFIPLVRLYPDFRPFWFVPIVIVEAGIFGMICDFILNQQRR
jgi:hypothetical protein